MPAGYGYPVLLNRGNRRAVVYHTTDDTPPSWPCCDKPAPASPCASSVMASCPIIATAPYGPWATVTLTAGCS